MSNAEWMSCAPASHRQKTLRTAKDTRKLLYSVKNQKKFLPQFCRCLLAMPTKKWGKANKAALSRLIEDGDVDIYDMSTANIDRVGAAHFPHQKKTSVATFATLLLLLLWRRNTAVRGGEEKKVSRRICLIVAFESLTFVQSCHPPTAHQ
jgi:hypothetical protein